MTSAGPAPGWFAPPAAAVPMTAKMPAPTIAPMPSEMSCQRPEHALELVLLRLGVDHDRVERLGPEELLGGAQTAGRIAEDRPGAVLANEADRRTSVRLPIRSGDVAVPPGPIEEQGLEPGGPRRLVVLARRVADVEGLGRPARRGARTRDGRSRDRACPVSSIAETRIASKRGASPRSASSAGRCESQLETTAEPQSRRARADRASDRRPVDRPGRRVAEVPREPREHLGRRRDLRRDDAADAVEEAPARTRTRPMTPP